MAEEKTRISRLTSILTHLQSKKLVTATELANKYEVSVRTIYRDMRTLEMSGVPIITEEGKGYSLVEGYKLPPVMFTEDEANALITAQQIINNNTDESFKDLYSHAITKIKAVLRHSQQEKTELLSNRIQIRKPKDSKSQSNHLVSIQSAIVNYTVVQINYSSLEGKTTERLIEPFAVYSTNENWILVAFCLLRKEFRAFRLDCIQQLSISEETFEPHNMTLQDYFKDCQKQWNTPDTPMTT